MLSIRRSQLGAAAVALVLATAGCGSNLTEAQVLARSGVTAPAPSLGSAAPSQVPSADPGPALVSPPGTTPRGRVPVAGRSPAPSAAPTPGAPKEAAIAAKPGAHPASTNASAAPGAGTPTPPAPSGKPSAGAANGACITSESGPIVVGNVGNYSGAGGSSQAGFPIAVQMWAASVNREGGSADARCR
jgi:hypothetical protein